MFEPRARITAFTLTISSLFLAVLYVVQPLFPWVHDRTVFKNPFETLILLIALPLALKAYQQFSWKGAVRSMVFPDWAMLWFLTFACLYTVLWHIWDPIHLIRLGVIGSVYLCARLIGLWRPRPFTVAVLTMSVLAACLSFPEIIAQSARISFAERVVIFNGILASQWPMMIVGSSSVMLTCLSTRRGWNILYLIPLSGLLWLSIFVGARSVAAASFISIGMVMLVSQAPLWKRFATIAITGFAFWFGFQNLPIERYHFFMQVPQTLMSPKMVTWTEKHAQALLVNDPAQNTVFEIREDGTCVIKNNSVIVRQVLRRTAIEVFTTHPIFGVGVGNFGHYSCIYGYGKIEGDPHSTILHVASELGLIGAIPFVGLILWLLYHGLMVWRRDLAYPWVFFPLFGGWVFHVVHNQFYSTYLAAIQYYLITGVLVGVISGRIRRT